MLYTQLITIEPDKRSGQPCIRGLRMTVQDVLEYLAGGMSTEEILADFPDLTAEDIRACLAFAADREPADPGPGPLYSVGGGRTFNVLRLPRPRRSWPFPDSGP